MHRLTHDMGQKTISRGGIRGLISTADALLPLRLITGWTYFSAFWRRLVLENKLDPDAAGYIGDKFNHFLPHALGIKPVLEFFLTHPELLWWKLMIFTIVEAIVGLALMLGLFTRLAGLLTSMLAFGILLSAGWIGTTCLDEWQIGILGITAGTAFLFAGGGRYSLDHQLSDRIAQLRITQRWEKLTLRFRPRMPQTLLFVSAFSFLLALGTNQIFHGGVWGKLHNKSVRPHVEITDALTENNALRFTLYRTEGADVYGSFLIRVLLKDNSEAIIAEWDGEALSKISGHDISNKYIAKIKPGAHSLVLPLGAKAEVTLRHESLEKLDQSTYTLELHDVSGAKWSSPVTIAR